MLNCNFRRYRRVPAFAISEAGSVFCHIQIPTGVDVLVETELFPAVAVEHAMRLPHVHEALASRRTDQFLKRAPLIAIHGSHSPRGRPASRSSQTRSQAGITTFQSAV